MLRAEIYHLADGPTLARMANLFTAYGVLGGGAQASNLTCNIIRFRDAANPSIPVSAAAVTTERLTTDLLFLWIGTPPALSLAEVNKTMFQRGDAVIYFEHMATGEVRQHFGNVLSVGQSGTYKVRFEDLPDRNLFFAYLTRAM